MKTWATRFILEKILEIGEVTIDAFFPKKYSYARFSRNLFGLDGAPKTNLQTFSSIVSRLKRQGLVTGKRRSGKMHWSITLKGKRWINSRHKRPLRILERDEVQRLVIFDVPERERKKRDILRAELVSCNFQQLQKSVWMGYNPLPEDFFELLDALQLKNNVHIFSVHNKGTLETYET